MLQATQLGFPESANAAQSGMLFHAVHTDCTHRQHSKASLLLH